MATRRRRRGSHFENIVASRYRHAGYKVSKHLITKYGEIDNFAIRKREKLAIECKSGKQLITARVIKKVYKKGKAIGAKPVLIIGSRIKISEPAKDLAEKLGVRIKRFKLK